MGISIKQSWLLVAGAALLMAACSKTTSVAPVKPKPVAAPAPAPLAPKPDPNAKVQTGAVEQFAFDEHYQGPAEGSIESVRALMGRGYLESAMREIMLAAVRTDYPMLGMRDVRLTDPVARFLGSEQAKATARHYLRSGIEARLGPIGDGRFEQIWQSLPKNGQVRHWSARLKQVLAGR